MVTKGPHEMTSDMPSNGCRASRSPAQGARRGRQCPAIAGRRIAERTALPRAGRPNLNCKGADGEAAEPAGMGSPAQCGSALSPGRRTSGGSSVRPRRGSSCWRESSVSMWQAMSRTICISQRPRMDRDGHLLSRGLAAPGTHAGTTQRRARLRFPPALPFRERVRQWKDLCEDDQPSREGREGLLSRVDRRNGRDHVQVGARQCRVGSAGRGTECAPDCPAAGEESHHNRRRPAHIRGAPC
jgi:hypothetical protein